MHVGVCTLRLRLLDNHSLKEKRRIVNSIKDRVRSKFNVSIAEVDSLDKWQLATLGIACISNESKFVNSVLSNVVSFIEETNLAELIDFDVEIF